MRQILTILLILFSIIDFSFAQEQNHYPMEIWFDKWSYDSSFEHIWENYSLPIGNGAFGANILGSVAVERVTLNEKTLWRGGPNTSGGAQYYWDVNKSSADVLPSIREAFLKGDYSEAAKLTKENFNGYAAYEEYNEEPFRFGSYTTMGEVLIYTDIDEFDISEYKRTLSLDSALVSVSFISGSDGVKYSRNYFASYPDGIMVWKFAADTPGRQNLRFSYIGNPLSELIISATGESEVLYSGSLHSNSMQYALRVGCYTESGIVNVERNGDIVVQDADEVLFILVADTDYKPNFNPDFSDPLTYVGKDPLKTTFKRLKTAKGYDYRALFSRHYSDYSELFNRVKLDLNRDLPMTLEYPPCYELPTDQRLQRYREGNPDYLLEELYFQYGRYLLISSSREGTMPANLQGLWSKGVDGPWRVDYHNNINIQMNYWPATSTNLLECYPPLIDYIRTLVKPGSVTAQSYFGARGWTASISSNIFGFTSPLNSEDMSWNFSPMSGPWLATHIWDYYDYTRDKKFLRKVGYPIISSSADFVVDYLWRHPDGYYTAAPSTSPEHGPIDYGATFLHGVAKEVLMEAVTASEILGRDKHKREEWKNVLDSLMPYKIGRYGQLMEWAEDIDDPDDRHRHVNHLYGLHPGSTISPEMTPDLALASKVVLDHRGDGATGWSMGWKLCQWARLKDGDRAYTLYNNLLRFGTLDNLWDNHPPFQIDGNFGGSAGVTEMLLQSHLGFIELLPALPAIWSSGSVKGLRARGGFEVDIEWSDGVLCRVNIKSLSGEDCSLKYKDTRINFKTRKGRSYLFSFENGIFLDKSVNY